MGRTINTMPSTDEYTIALVDLCSLERSRIKVKTLGKGENKTKPIEVKGIGENYLIPKKDGTWGRYIKNAKIKKLTEISKIKDKTKISTLSKLLEMKRKRNIEENKKQDR